MRHHGLADRSWNEPILSAQARRARRDAIRHLVLAVAVLVAGVAGALLAASSEPWVLEQLAAPLTVDGGS